MKIGIIGLGLIGGSLAKAIKQNTSEFVYGYDLNNDVILSAINANAIVDRINDISEMDMIFVCLYPDAAVDFIQKNAFKISKETIVIDCCGVKRPVVYEFDRIAKEHGFIYIGGHPMAGTEKSGFSASRENLFMNASMIITPMQSSTSEAINMAWDILSKAGFSSLTISTPDEHDKLISYTSQLAHVVSAAYVLDPIANDHMGFSAGSFLDMTRVARLNEDMWTQLFLQNSDHLSDQIDGFIDRLSFLRDAIRNKDEQTLYEMLKSSRLTKEAIDLKREEKNENS